MKDEHKKLTTDVGAPVTDNTNSLTAGERGGMMLQDLWHMEKLAHFAPALSSLLESAYKGIEERSHELAFRWFFCILSGFVVH